LLKRLPSPSYQYVPEPVPVVALVSRLAWSKPKASDPRAVTFPATFTV